MVYRPRTNPLTSGAKLGKMSQTAAAMRRADRARIAKTMENAEAALLRDHDDENPKDEGTPRHV